MSGVNTPVPVLLPENAGVESRIFKGAGRCRGADLKRRPGRDLRRGRGPGPFSLLRGQSTAGAGSEPPVSGIQPPRGELFRKTAVSASGDVKPVVFLCHQPFILALMLSAIPVSGFLQPPGSCAAQTAPPGRRRSCFHDPLPDPGAGPSLHGPSPVCRLRSCPYRRYSVFLRASRSASALKRFCVLPGCMRLPGGGEPDGRRTFPVPGSHSAALFFRRDPAPGVPSSLPSRRRPRSFRPYIFIETVKMAVTAHWEPWIFAALPAVFPGGNFHKPGI